LQAASAGAANHSKTLQIDYAPQGMPAADDFESTVEVPTRRGWFVPIVPRAIASALT
jgi:hypothetical protein